MQRTQFHKAVQTCPYCFNEESVTIWDIVDAQEDPDLRERLLQKGLQVLDCRNCGRHYILHEPLLYIDRAEQFALYVHPALEAEELPEELLETLPVIPASEGAWRLRLCATYNDLLEKIHAFEAGLDDRILEGVKLSLRVALRSEEGRSFEDFRFLGIQEDRFIFWAKPVPLTESEQILAQETEENEGEESVPNLPKAEPESLSLSPELYQNAEKLFAPHLQTSEGWLCIDALWARNFLNQLTETGCV